MKKIITLLLSLSILSSIFAQESLMDAKVYLKDNQVLNGNVYLYDSEPNVIVLENENGESSRFFIENIVYIENDGNQLRPFLYEDGYVLFDVIVSGSKMSLLKTNFNEQIVFYVYTGDKVYLLEGGRKAVTKGSKTYNTDNLRYRGVLKVLMESDPKLVKKLDIVKYNEKELSNIVVAYNGGKISFLKTKEGASKNKKPNLLVYMQYTNSVTNRWFTLNNRTSAFYQGGVQLYFSKESRHSLKMGLEYGVYTQPDSKNGNYYKIANLNLSYYYDFYRMRHSAIYFNVRAGDIIYVIDSDELINSGFVIPRISPGFGFKYQIKNLFLFAEINNIIQYQTVPYNFSAGISIDL